MKELFSNWYLLGGVVVLAVALLVFWPRRPKQMIDPRGLDDLELKGSPDLPLRRPPPTDVTRDD